MHACVHVRVHCSVPKTDCGIWVRTSTKQKRERKSSSSSSVEQSEGVVLILFDSSLQGY